MGGNLLPILALRFGNLETSSAECFAELAHAASQAGGALRLAPHPAGEVTADEWNHAYSREVAAFPAPWVKEHKFWPPVARVDNGFGDRNLICSCPPMEAFGGQDSGGASDAEPALNGA